MRSFNKEKTVHTEIPSQLFKMPIPVAYVTPETIDSTSCVFVYVSGIAFPITSALYLNNDFYNKHWFVAYDKMGQGTNKNPSNQFKTKYVEELKEVVQWAKTQFPGRKVYLLGESWGGAILFLFMKNHSYLVNGSVSWNVPTRPKDPDKNKGKVLWECFFKEVATLLTNKKLYLPVVQKTQEKVSNNPLFVRAMSLFPQERQDSRSTISVWRYMHFSKRFLRKNAKGSELNFMYIQSGEDALADLKFMKKLSTKADPKHFCLLPSGKHVLSLEPKESQDLYRLVEEVMKRG